MKYLAFDLGASSGKMMLGNLRNGMLDIKLVHRFSNRQIQMNHALFWDIINIYSNLKTGLQKALIESDDSLCIGIDSFCNDFGLIDKNGNLMTQVRCYRDPRTQRCCDAIYKMVSPWELYQQTGSQVALFNTSMQMASMVLENDGFLLEKCEHALLIPDLLNYFLCGEKHTEYTLASVSQLMDWKTDKWAVGMMRKLSIPTDIFPDVTATETRVGKISQACNPDISRSDISVISVPGHDTASAVAALPTNQDHVAYISSGTWSLVGTEVERPIITEEAFKHNIAYEGGIDHRYRMIKNVMGLWIMQECCRDYEQATHQECSYDFVAQAVSSAKPLQFFIDPDSAEFYMPGNMIHKVKEYCRRTNQQVPSDFGQVARCVLESLALKYRYVFEIIEKITGYPLPEIYILGGGSQNILLNQFVANACKRCVYAGPSEAALAGNMISQMKSTGEITNLKEGRDIVKNSFDIRVFEPCDTSIWEEKYQQFLNLKETI